MQLTIRFAGYGGYGIVTASRTLGLSFTAQGYHVLQTESHGAAARGGACTANLTVSSSPIYELEFSKPDTLIVLSTSGFQKCYTICSEISSNTLLIESNLLDDPTVQKFINRIKKEEKIIVYQLDFHQIVEKLGHVRYFGIAALGALSTIDNRVNFPALENTIKTDAKLKRFSKQNLKALNLGAKLVSILYGKTAWSMKKERRGLGS
ncbi:MAG: 2-oxoacid:acceptor oxidoreductase family protein [Promethearchaeota archaeon]